MFLIESGPSDESAFDGKLLFATQMASRGYDVVLDDQTFPADSNRYYQFEAAPFLASLDTVVPDDVFILGAEHITDDTLLRIRRLSLPATGTIAAIGRFDSQQAKISAQSRIGFALGREASVADLTSLNMGSLFPRALSPLVSTGEGLPAGKRKVPELFLFLPVEWLEDDLTLPLLATMCHLPGFHLNVIISGQGKEIIRNSRYSDIPTFGYSELSPRTLAGLADIAVIFGGGVPGERMAIFALEMMVSGKVVVDGTSTSAFAGAGAPAIRGPEALGSIAHFLEHLVLPNLVTVGQEAANSDWIAQNSFVRLEKELGISPPHRTAKKPRKNGTFFLPTNGVGLGHARRSALIALEMPKATNPSFMAFPSCIPLINEMGISAQPLVQKSEYHSQEYANDLVNYLRMSRHLKPGDKLVFDGGFVFDSIYRTIMEKNLSATWIRRGLLQPGQVNFASLDREKAFERVIVPNEVFDELNEIMTFSNRVRRVGPVVHVDRLKPSQIKQRRAALKDRFDFDFDHLVVSMLGAGYAADRSAQLQAICSMLEARGDCLHLIVAWPNAQIAPGLFSWKNSKLVRTTRPMILSQTADLVLSAVGYNSFSEILYHGVPAIYIPQMSTATDDQKRRAQAAADRGLGSMVQAHEMLLLDREVRAYLDNDKARDVRKALAAAEMPALGNADAARLIEETGHDA